MFLIIDLQDQKLFRTNATTEIVGCTNSHDDYTNCIIVSDNGYCSCQNKTRYALSSLHRTWHIDSAYSAAGHYCCVFRIYYQESKSTKLKAMCA